MPDDQGQSRDGALPLLAHGSGPAGLVPKTARPTGLNETESIRAEPIPLPPLSSGQVPSSVGSVGAARPVQAMRPALDRLHLSVSSTEAVQGDHRREASCPAADPFRRRHRPAEEAWAQGRQRPEAQVINVRCGHSILPFAPGEGAER